MLRKVVGIAVSVTLLFGIVEHLHQSSSTTWRQHSRIVQALETLHHAETDYKDYLNRAPGSGEGYYDSLACLESPQDCVPGYPVSAGAVLSSPRPPSGYKYRYYPGPAPSSLSPNHSPTSVTRYAITAIAQKAESLSWLHFCIDASAVLKAYPERTLPSGSDGRCSDGAVAAMTLLGPEREDYENFYGQAALSPAGRFLKLAFWPLTIAAFGGWRFVRRYLRKRRHEMSAGGGNDAILSLGLVEEPLDEPMD